MASSGLSDHLPPAHVLDAAGIDAEDLTSLVDDKPIWVFSSAEGPAVLKARRAGFEAGIAWEMALLRRVAPQFPVPLPLDVFQGRSWTTIGTRTWLAHTCLPGQAMGWQDAPSLGELGAFLAQYHRTVQQLRVARRPGTDDPTALFATVSARAAQKVLADDAAVDTFVQLRRALPSNRDDHDGRLAIHGDFTVDNVLVDGTPPSCSGAIDFGMAQIGPRVADLAWSAWRSARSSRSAIELDLNRLRDLVSGYRSASDAEIDSRQLIDWLVRRGLLWVALASHGVVSSGAAAAALQRARWIDDHGGQLVEAIT